MGRFRRLINDLELKEAHLIGRHYTWSNGCEHPTMVRLDRWFLLVDWNDLFPDSSLHALSSSLSDHCPLLLSTATCVRAKRRFRFEPFWTKLDGFLDVVKAAWQDQVAPTEPLYRLGFKLRMVGRALQQWSQQQVGSIKDQLLMTHEVILRLDVAQESCIISALVELRRSLKRRVLGLASLERTIARQRARVAGVKEGDANAQFFRMLAAKRTRRNYITSLKSGGSVVTSQGGLEEVALDFFV
jgi:hypothetical protein